MSVCVSHMRVGECMCECMRGRERECVCVCANCPTDGAFHSCLMSVISRHQVGVEYQKQRGVCVCVYMCM